MSSNNSGRTRGRKARLTGKDRQEFVERISAFSAMVADMLTEFAIREIDKMELKKRRRKSR